MKKYRVTILWPYFIVLLLLEIFALVGVLSGGAFIILFGLTLGSLITLTVILLEKIEPNWWEDMYDKGRNSE